MSTYDPLDAKTDPFFPPAVPTLVSCLHCGREYVSDQIEWRIERDAKGQPRGFWCCPITGCNGLGFGFDILPVDPNDRDERGGWVLDDEETSENGEEIDWEPLPGSEPSDDDPQQSDDEDPIPF